MEQAETINNFEEQKSEVVNPFSKLLSRIKNFKVYEWMNFIGMFLFLISFVWTIRDFVNYIHLWTIRDFVNYIHLGKPEAIFFGIFDRFTNQSNWILFIFAFMYFWWPNLQIRVIEFYLSLLLCIFDDLIIHSLKIINS